MKILQKWRKARKFMGKVAKGETAKAVERRESSGVFRNISDF
jgi:hypothetical protein